MILVVWHHIFQDYTNDSLPRYLLPIKYFFVEYGAYGVEIFFCLSGFIIFSMNNDENKRFHFWKFMRGRYTRLLPGIFILGLISIPILGIQQWVFSVLPSVTLIDPSIFNKITGIQNFSWFSNVMWTLFTEIRFYTIFALVFWFLRNKSINLRLFGLISIFLVTKIFILVTSNKFLETLFQLVFITKHSSYFILGMVLAFVYSKRSNRNLRSKLVPVSTLVLLLFFLENSISADESLKFAFLSPILIIFVLWRVDNPFVGRLSKYIGVPSYISYLTHLHFISILRLIGLNQNPPIELILLPFMIFVLSYVIHLKIEEPAIQYFRSKL